jgi:hypothetical protein
MMYNGSNQFGKAYQEEMRRIAGVGDEQENEARRQIRSQEQGLLRRLLGGLFGRRKEAEPAQPLSIREPRRSMSR